MCVRYYCISKVQNYKYMYNLLYMECTLYMCGYMCVCRSTCTDVLLSTARLVQMNVWRAYTQY